LIRITDRTLSCLDGLPPDKPALSRFLSLMIKLDPGAIELSETMYRLLSPLPEYPFYVLRLSKAADAEKYPHIAEFICPEETSSSVDVRIRVEIPRDDITDAVITDYADSVTAAERSRSRAVYTKLRVVGLDGELCGDYPQTFERLKHHPVEFCPANSLHCATALAAEWVMSDAGDGVVTAFGGLGGFAATEELIMILRINNLLGINRSYDFLPEMASLFEHITKKNIAPNKPIIGKRIFQVESGIHVDGILKQPKCYEPFPPDIVGQTRKIVLGKQSGIASIRAKLSEFKLRCDDEELPIILAGVKAKAAEKRGAVTDGEFLDVFKSVHGDITVFVNDINTINSINDINTVNGTDNLITGTKPRRYIVDSTLRDGEQTPGIFFSARQKSEIAALLDSCGVHQIEAGVPAASKEEKESIAGIIKNRKNALISVWARLVPSDIEHAIDVRPDLIHICVPVSQTQIREKLRTDKESVIKRLRECLRTVEKSGIPLSVGFEDAFRADTDFMILAAQILLDSGVTRIRVSDTVGVASPSQCGALLKEITDRLNGKVALGIHAHNDLGMAVANTIEAAKSGCLYADVTVGGIGERAGNCGLAELVNASASIFDWGMTASEALNLQRAVLVYRS